MDTGWIPTAKILSIYLSDITFLSYIIVFLDKGKAVDLRQIGRELNVRYVLESSVQRGGNRMGLNLQLIDAETGNHLWAERFDKPLSNLFSMQHEIVASLASQLGAELITNEARRAERMPNPDSMDLYFQGMSWFNKGLYAKNMPEARGFFERALTRSRHVDALLGTAAVDQQVAATTRPKQARRRRM
jgi:hypothetical protein